VVPSPLIRRCSPATEPTGPRSRGIAPGQGRRSTVSRGHSTSPCSWLPRPTAARLAGSCSSTSTTDRSSARRSATGTPATRGPRDRQRVDLATCTFDSIPLLVQERRKGDERGALLGCPRAAAASSSAVGDRRRFRLSLTGPGDNPLSDGPRRPARRASGQIALPEPRQLPLQVTRPGATRSGRPSTPSRKTRPVKMPDQVPLARREPEGRPRPRSLSWTTARPRA